MLVSVAYVDDNTGREKGQWEEVYRTTVPLAVDL